MSILDNIKSIFNGNAKDEDGVVINRENDGSIFTNLFNGFGRQNRDKSEKLSALNCGMGLIADSIASLPVYKYQINKDGSKTKVKSKINYLLNSNCNQFTTSYNMKNMIIKNSIFYGNGYIKIVRDDNFEIKELIPLQQESVMLMTNDCGKSYYYQVTLNGQVERLEYYEVINLCSNSVDGVLGRGILVTGAETLGLASSQQLYSGAVFENGVFAKGILYVDSNFSAEQRNQMKDKFKGFFSKGNSGRLLVLPNNTEYKPISLSPTDLDLLKEKEFTIQEIARLLKIRPELLGVNISSGNYKNLEEGNRQFLQFTLLPYLKNLEAVLNHYLLTETEKESGEYCFCFDLSQLMESDIKTQSEVLSKYVSSGIMSVKEVRNKLNLPFIEGTDSLTYTSFNSILKDGEFINMQSLNKIKEDGEVEKSITKEEINVEKDINDTTM
ncbi:phage portal protein [Clostridium perfringens]|uniref:phage portal protein n=1 Tax=Clostridium perfringens TaxID=1502 RepID=UPI001D888CE5|nr:phage portal protein [Clostridium perfringens]EGT0692902.1 phage portal protein [Clostridium perfringens]EIF6167634.1 phage portal protein [Clostridium perfringens]ELC8395789.1 phage portal protein [Clostridium perfringens]MDH5074800.1 Phage portal protein [Clostridium perfringens]MDM0635117.1 phage portal protein [Clostridium perfringens]